jgi:hypothetical protein
MMKESMDKNETESSYQQWERVLKKMNYKTAKFEENINHPQMDKLENGTENLY